jgi:hypothetical protein
MCHSPELPNRYGHEMANKPAPKKPLERELMVTHTRHQFELLALAMDRLRTPPDEQSYESRVAHATIRVAELTALRTVIDFFKNIAGDYITNMTASDYATEWDPESGHIARNLADLSDTRIRINERVAHTDVQRVRTKAPTASESTIREKVNRLMREFTKQVDEQWRGCFYPSLDVALEVISLADPGGPPLRLPLQPDGTVMPREAWPQDDA